MLESNFSRSLTITLVLTNCILQNLILYFPCSDMFFTRPWSISPGLVLAYKLKVTCMYPTEYASELELSIASRTGTTANRKSTLCNGYVQYPAFQKLEG